MRNNTCNLWFHPRKFIENNIKYRIASSDAISKYKHSQTFLLSELAFNPFHEFSRVAKEILLLKYDVWFDFICEVEQYLLVENCENVTEEIAQIIIDMSDDRVIYYEGTMSDNPDVFEEKFTELWKSVHKEVYYILLHDIRMLVGTTPVEFFQTMIESLVNIMNHTLYELQEIDVLLFTENTFQFNVDSLCCRYQEITNESLVGKKIDLFETVRHSPEVLIKMYSDVRIPFQMTSLKTYLEEKQIQYKVI